MLIEIWRIYGRIRLGLDDREIDGRNVARGSILSCVMDPFKEKERTRDRVCVLKIPVGN